MTQYSLVSLHTVAFKKHQCWQCCFWHSGPMWSHEDAPIAEDMLHRCTDACIDSARRAPNASLPYLGCSRHSITHEVSMSSSSDKYLPSTSITDSVVPGLTPILDLEPANSFGLLFGGGVGRSISCGLTLRLIQLLLRDLARPVVTLRLHCCYMRTSKQTWFQDGRVRDLDKWVQ